MAIAVTALVFILALIVCSRRRVSARVGAITLVLGTVAVGASAGSLGVIPAGGVATAAPGGPTAQTGAAGPLYRRLCLRCHGADGKGERGAGVPDFSQPAWHKRRGDARLAAAILEGKGSAMPAFAGRLSKAQARALVAHLRAFAPALSGSSGNSGNFVAAANGADFDAQLRQLQREFEELRQQFRELTTGESGAEKPSTGAATRDDTRPVSLSPRPSGRLFRQLCQRCHGASGEGIRDKGDGDLPDFRRREWHRQHSDAELLASILKGTDGSMPAFGHRISEAEARGLVTHVRGFAVAGPQERRPAEDSPESAAAGR
jgi:mono/diheme cytochrome c family protein